MQAKGIFYVTDCNQQTNAENGQGYLELDLTELVEKQDQLASLSLGEGNFRCIYMGNGLEAGRVYELELEVSVASNCSFTSQVLSYRQLEV
ncbi:MAG: hypothetical protein Q4G58_11690 [bacterium]|nr:hypothetical protein [bacterium]